MDHINDLKQQVGKLIALGDYCNIQANHLQRVIDYLVDDEAYCSEIVSMLQEVIESLLDIICQVERWNYLKQSRKNLHQPQPNWYD